MALRKDSPIWIVLGGQSSTAFVLSFGQPESPFFASPKKGDPKKGDPGKPSAFGGCARRLGCFRRHIRVPTKTSPASLRATPWADPSLCAGCAGDPKGNSARSLDHRHPSLLIEIVHFTRRLIACLVGLVIDLAPSELSL